MSVGFKHHSDSSGYIDPKELEEAEEDELEGVTVDCDHDVPFCAGLSTDGKTLFVDHAIYDEVKNKKGYLRCLIIHEMTEHLMMRVLKMPYKPAHNIATAAEECCVKASGIDKKTYDDDWSRWIRKVASRGTYDNVPEDLDTEPYDQDDEKAEEDHKLDHGLFGHYGKAGYAA
jgi:hypothetical protein